MTATKTQPNTPPEPYAGFPRRVRVVPVPAPLLGSLLAEIDDMAELKCTLRAIALLSRKRGHPRFVTLREMQADESLARSIPFGPSGPTDDGDKTAADLIERALGAAVRRGTLAFAIVGAAASRQPIFGLNSELDRNALEKIAQEPPEWLKRDHEPPPILPSDRPNAFELYEQNIGMLSPMIADALREAEDMYPEEWIEDAIDEAVKHNKRSWRYVSAILERWEREGRGHWRMAGSSETVGQMLRSYYG